MAPARNVCQGVEYCVQPQMLQSGRAGVIAPLDIVVDGMRVREKECRREIAWIRAVLKRLEEETFSFVKYLDA